MNHQNLADLIWNIAEDLRSDFKASEFGRIILPFTVLRRLETVLESPHPSTPTFSNASTFTLATLSATSTRANLEQYIAGFSQNARQIFEHFAFERWIEKLERAKLLFPITQKFASFDLHPDKLSNYEMGLAFEHLIRKFAESANDTAGEFFTPRDVVRLTTTLVFAPDNDALNQTGTVRKIYDCAMGTGGFLSSADELLQEWGATARLVLYGQELNPETYAICVGDKLIQNHDTRNLKLGNTLSDDQLPHEKFHYCLANPPFGVKWEKVQRDVTNEHKQKGHTGRFGPGLPRVNDGSMLFLMHLLSKRRPVQDGGSRIGIVLSGSPLFNGGAASGESEIRRWILENDFLEAIVALPNDLFYNTGIATYVWILSNRKTPDRKSRVQLIDATNLHASMRKSLGSKRKLITDDQIAAIARVHANFEACDATHDSPAAKIFKTTDFAYRRITIERPLRLRFQVTPETLEAYRQNKSARETDKFASLTTTTFDDFQAFLKAANIKKLTQAATNLALATFGTPDASAQPVRNAKGEPIPDTNRRETENVPLHQDIDTYFTHKVLPHAPDAWIDRSKTDTHDNQPGIVGYEINFNRYFYTYLPPRPLSEIDAELRTLEAEIAELLKQIT